LVRFSKYPIHFLLLRPYNAWMSREHGRSRACEAEAAEGTGVALAQAGDMTAARRRFNPLVMRRPIMLLTGSFSKLYWPSFT